MLDSMPVEPPSSLLAAQVLAAAPRRRSRRLQRWTIAAAVPLAAAAAVVVWVSVERKPARTVSAAAAVQVGEYTSPTDVLLDAYGVDVYATVPSVGCSDSVLGCPDVDRTGGPRSGVELLGRVRA
jgi:HAMP domain-containing protein